MKREDFRFAHRLRVRWAEVDVQRIVFNAHYLMYVDTAIADYWRALALPYADAMHALAGDLYVKKAVLEWHASAHLDDRLDIGLRCERIDTASMLFVAGIFRDDELLVAGEVVYVFADPATQTAQPVPDALRALLLGYEAGETVWTLRYSGGDAEADAPQAASWLQTPGSDKQNPAPCGADVAFDGGADVLRLGIVNRLGQTVAVAHLSLPVADLIRIDRVAVHPSLRGAGLGRAVVAAAIEAAAARGASSVVLDAPGRTETFFRRCGFAVQTTLDGQADTASVRMAADPRQRSNAAPAAAG